MKNLEHRTALHGTEPHATRAPARRAYEPPRLLAKRAVERVTLSFTTPINPDQPIGDQP